MDWGALPRHYRLRTALVEKIASGQWKEHDPIPSERDLEQTYNVSRTTVRRAIDDLVNQGYVYREHGRGTFVSPLRPALPRAGLVGFAEELLMSRKNAAIRVMESGIIPVPAAVAETLQVAIGDPVIRLLRLVIVDAEPLLLAESFVPGHLGGPELAIRLEQANSLYQALEMGGITIGHGQQQLRAVLLDPVTATHLGAASGGPGLEITRVTYSLEGTVIEMSRGVYHGDRYRYVVDLTRGPRQNAPEGR